MYNIKKSYDSKPSKNGYEEKNMTIDKAKNELQNLAILWKKNGGSVVEQGEELLIVQEANGSETITFSLEEINE